MSHTLQKLIAGTKSKLEVYDPAKKCPSMAKEKESECSLDILVFLKTLRTTVLAVRNTPTDKYPEISRKDLAQK